MVKIRMSFGKYKGQTLEEIVEHSPGYIIWLHRNVKSVKIPSKVLAKAYSFIESSPHDHLEELGIYYGY